MSIINLASLPSPNLVEKIDFEEIFQSRKADFLNKLPSHLRAPLQAMLELENEPLTRLLQESAYREMILRNKINQTSLSSAVASRKRQ